MGACLRIPAPSTLSVPLGQSAFVAFTRARCEERDRGMTNPIPAEDASILSLQLRDFGEHELWLGSRALRSAPSRQGTFTFLDLKQEPRAYLRDPFDSLHFYVPRTVFAAISTEAGESRVAGLQLPHGVPQDDPVIRDFAAVVLPALEQPGWYNRLFLEHLSLALVAHLARTYGSPSPPPRLDKGKLAPWQERRVKDFLIANISGGVSLADVAQECGLSRTHLSRAFKTSTGQPPHRWLLEQRIERARKLLLHSKLPLADISRRCGFADQSHFTRVMNRALGSSPGAWRRWRRT
jgi:AraC-like DNA-binding protein